jgi:hypothetical protein
MKNATVEISLNLKISRGGIFEHSSQQNLDSETEWLYGEMVIPVSEISATAPACLSI